MNTEDLETLLEGTSEGPSLEFKEACHWSAKTYVKDILAMANEEDGGAIIVGVTNANRRDGVDRTIAGTYVLDTMRDQIAPFATPAVEFHLAQATDRQGKLFVVISVLPFRDEPVICAKSGHDVTEGVVYCRPTNGRARSAPVGALEMRRILEVAAAKKVARFRSLGLVPEALANASAEYDRELDDL